MKSFSVLGAGAWGTALAFQLARANPDANILLWGHDPQKQATLSQARCNQIYFPQYPFPENIQPVITLESAIPNDGIVIAVPSDGFRDLAQQLELICPPALPILSTTKGLDPHSGNFLHTVFKIHDPIAVLSGPSFATEVMAELPTAVTIAAEDSASAQFWQKHFHSENFRVYTSDDRIGVQLSGAIKNVLAIATGVADGLSFGANARSALITRGLAEMKRLNDALGGKQTTLMGLAGVGDLVLTCTDNQSRNRRFGIALGQGKSLTEALTSVQHVVEGYRAAPLLYALAKQHGIDMPICNGVYAILHENKPVDLIIKALLQRTPKEE